MAAYFFTLCKLTNPDEKFIEYAKKSRALIEQHGGRYFIHNGPLEAPSGPFEGMLMVGLEFPDVDALKAYRAAAAEIIPLREGAGEFYSAGYNDELVFGGARKPAAVDG